MSWNHRIVKRKQDDPYDPYQYAIHEAHYGEDGAIEGWTLDPIAPIADDLEGLRWTLEHMLEALNQPVLDEAEYDARWEAQRQAREAEYQEKYGGLSFLQQVMAVHRDTEGLCNVRDDTRVCRFALGHEGDHYLVPPESILRDVIRGERGPHYALQDLFAEPDTGV